MTRTTRPKRRRRDDRRRILGRVEAQHARAPGEQVEISDPSGRRAVVVVRDQDWLDAELRRGGFDRAPWRYDAGYRFRQAYQTAHLATGIRAVDCTRPAVQGGALRDSPIDDGTRAFATMREALEGMPARHADAARFVIGEGYAIEEYCRALVLRQRPGHRNSVRRWLAEALDRMADRWRLKGRGVCHD